MSSQFIIICKIYISKLKNDNIPNDVNAFFSSFLSIAPELSLSKVRKHACQSVTYFHSAVKS